MSEPTLEMEVERWLYERDGREAGDLEALSTIRRFLQLARREGFTRGWKAQSAEQPELAAEASRFAFPIRRTVTKPNIQQCENGPWVRADSSGGVNFFRSRQDAVDWQPGSGSGNERYWGLSACWLPTINEVAQHPTINREVEE